MIHLKKFNENVSNWKELKFDEEMMYKTSALMNLLPLPNPYNDSLEKISDTIMTSLSSSLISKLFEMDIVIGRIKRGSDIFINFVTSKIDEEDLKRMFKNVEVHEGSDLEEEYVSALEINGKIVLLLHSPDRGSQIRVEDNKFSIKFDEVLSIIESLCKIYNSLL